MYQESNVLQITITQSNPKKYVEQKIKFAFGQKLSNEQAIRIFSAYAETPETLNDYLKQVIKKR